MKLVYPDMKMQINLQPGAISEMILENPKIFSKYLSELYAQIHGEEGRFVLSEDGSILKISACMECIINPYTLDANMKKILSKVYTVIKSEIQDTELYLEYEELLAMLEKFAENIVEHMDTPLEYDMVEDVGNLLKLFNFKIAVDDTAQMVERLIDYLKILSEYAGIKVVVLVNIKSYISDVDMKYLQETCAYLGIAVLLIESVEGYAVDGVMKYIIDKDGCEIYI